MEQQVPPGSPRLDVKLEVGGVQGLHNPLSWDCVPSSLKEKFPHWKESSPLAAPAHPRTSSEGQGWVRDVTCVKMGVNVHVIQGVYIFNSLKRFFLL